MTVVLPALFHVGIVVADMEAASKDFERRWGLETEQVIDLSVEGAKYRGETVDFTARYGFIRSGGSDIELIQPLSGPTPYGDFLETNGGDGMHHLAYIVEAIDPYLDQLATVDGSVDVLLDAAMTGGGRFLYVDSAANGAVIELIEAPSNQDEPTS